MSVDVVTEATCNKCEKVVKEKGGGYSLPGGWGTLTLIVPSESGDIKQRVKLDLCPSCVGDTLKFLGVPRKRTRKAKIIEPTTVEIAPGLLMTSSGTEQPERKRGRPRKVPSAYFTEPEPAFDGVTPEPVSTIEDVVECSWATGPHQHGIEGGDVVCLAPPEQLRKPTPPNGGDQHARL